MFRDCFPNLYCADLDAHSGNGQRVAYVTDPDGNRIHLYA